MKEIGLSGFNIKLPLFFKIFNFPDFRSIGCIFQPIENAFINLVWIYLAWLLLNWCLINQIYFLIDRTRFQPIKIRKLSLLKSFSLVCSSLFQKLFRLFLSFSLQSIQSKGFLLFSSKNFSKVFVLKHW